jgi:predicted amidohydrolase YtcJ
MMTGRQSEPDIILLNGRFITIDKNFSIQKALSIRCAHIHAVGGNEELKSLAGKCTKIIDLEGHSVIPGIIDAHAHMDREGLKTIQPGLEGVHSITDILDIIKREVKQKEPGEWVVTMPIGDPPNYGDVPARLAEKKYPTRYDLDKAAPENPVYIRGIWSPWNSPPSISIANSKALKIAGINRHTQSPHPSVIIERDAKDEPTGVIIDNNMYPITEFSLMRVVPRFSHNDRLKALKKSMRLYNSVGITGIYEGHGVAPEVLDVYKTIWDEGEFTVRSRLVISPTWLSMKQATSDMSRWSHCVSRFGFGDDMLKLCGFFIQLRGERHVDRLRSSQLPYTGWAGFAITYNTLPRFLSLLQLAARLKIRVHTLASTEDELEEVLQAFNELEQKFKISQHRWVIGHVRHVKPSQLKLMKRLGVVCETIPLTHLWLRGAPYLKDPDRSNHIVPHQAFLQHNIPFCMGTDNKPYNPFNTFWAAVERIEQHSGTVIGPKQCLTRAQALHALTMGGSYLSCEETLRGSLEPGKLADLAVLTDDPLIVPAERLQNIQALLTIVNGRFVYDSGRFGT